MIFTFSFRQKTAVLMSFRFSLNCVTWANFKLLNCKLQWEGFNGEKKIVLCYKGENKTIYTQNNIVKNFVVVKKKNKFWENNFENPISKKKFGNRSR